MFFDGCLGEVAFGQLVQYFSFGSFPRLLIIIIVLRHLLHIRLLPALAQLTHPVRHALPTDLHLPELVVGVVQKHFLVEVKLVPADQFRLCFHVCTVVLVD